VSVVTIRLVSGVGVGGAALVATAQLGLVAPVVLAVAVLGGLPLLLITVLALAAVYSRDPVRRSAAENILCRLLSTARPRRRSDSRCSTPKGRGST